MNCPHCNQEIPNKSEFCIFCGEKIVQKKKARTTIILSILLAFSLIVAGGELVYILIREGQVSQLIDNYDHNLAIRKERINELEERINELKKKAYFLDNHIAIVPDDGTRIYHNYGCEKLDLSYFWAYNNEAAIDNGYRPCPYCH